MTTSVKFTRAEITRFLRGVDPGVLCVSGEWGVGKTFLWRSVLDTLRNARELSLTRYSYVSLFGLNSLDDVKASLFENMEWLDQDATDFAGRGKAGAKALATRAKRLSELAGALPWVGQAFSKARSLYFSLIQSQIVCIDDLERRSKNLDVKDVLGLMSFLREQRGCKVALLLNAERLGDDRDEFYDLLEKVIETKVVLAPTAAESVAIAITGQDAISVTLRRHCETLGIRNIRVLKQIERLARRTDEIVRDFPQPIRDQAAHSVVLFGWSKYDRANAPGMKFLKTSSIERHLERRSENAPSRSKKEAAWEALLVKYKFTRTDNFDFALLKCVDSMALDVDDIQTEARALQEQQRIGALHGTFKSAWRKFHDSFDADEDKVVEQVVESTKKAVEVVSLPNLNEAMALLKSLERESEASELLKFFAENHNPSYWTEVDPFGRGPFLPEVDAVIRERSEVEPEEFDVAAALVLAGENCDASTISKLAAVPAQTYFELISAARGAQLRKLILSALEFRRIANATDDMKRVTSLMEEALQMVGRTSRLNAIRIKKYGVSI